MASLAAWLRELFGREPEVMALDLPTPARAVEPVGEVIEARETAVRASPPCDLPEYRAIVKALPRPSDAQIDDFVKFVCEAHSWYKHLPLLPPGTPFRFFIDPHSGCDQTVRNDGSAAYSERTESTPRFHYTWMTTAKYRLRFGHLAYEAAAGNRFVLPTAGGVLEYAERPIIVDGATAYRIPADVAAAGSVPVTAVVHPLTARTWVWDKFLPSRPHESWPIETGGDETLEAIKAVCRRALEQNPRVKDEIDADLVRLLEPEKRRLQREMEKAIKRVVELVYDDAD